MTRYLDLSWNFSRSMLMMKTTLIQIIVILMVMVATSKLGYISRALSLMAAVAVIKMECLIFDLKSGWCIN